MVRRVPSAHETFGGLATDERGAALMGTGQGRDPAVPLLTALSANPVRALWPRFEQHLA